MRTLMKDLGDLSGLDITAPDRTMSSMIETSREPQTAARPARTWRETLRALRARLTVRTDADDGARCRDTPP